MSRGAELSALGVVFDLDGTLVDSSEAILAALNAVREAEGLPQAEREWVVPRIGLPASELFADVPDTGRTGERVERFRHYLARDGGRGTRLYPGVPELLEALGARGARLGLATTKPSPLARVVLADAGLLGFFDHVQGTDGFPAKPAPDVVTRCLEALDSPASAFMVGDTPQDILAGRAAGVTTVAVAQSAHDRAELAAFCPDHLLDAVAESLPLVLELQPSS